MKQEFIITSLSKVLVFVLILYFSSLYIEAFLLDAALIIGFTFITADAIYQFFRFKDLELNIIQKRPKSEFNSNETKIKMNVMLFLILPISIIYAFIFLQENSLFIYVTTTVLFSFIYYIGLIATYRYTLFMAHLESIENR